VVSENNKVAFIFPGQGSQSVGMGRSFFDDYKDYTKSLFEEADDILGFSLSDMCWNGPAELLSKTENTQPAILLTSYVAASLLKREGIMPHYIAGHSLGEYSALAFGGAFSFKDALSLVRKRGELMSEAVPKGIGKMAALLGITERKIVSDIVEEASEADSRVEIANFNCPGQIVIGGHKEAVLRACEIAKSRGARKAVVLDVSVPSHTSLMAPVKEKIRKKLDELSVKPVSVPLVNNIEARTVQEPDDIKKSLISQLTQSVMWEDSIRKLLALGVGTFVEVGAGKVLAGLTRKIDSKVNMVNIFDSASLKRAFETLIAA